MSLAVAISTLVCLLVLSVTPKKTNEPCGETGLR